jgi:hypothetical protein
MFNYHMIKVWLAASASRRLQWSFFSDVDVRCANGSQREARTSDRRNLSNRSQETLAKIMPLTLLSKHVPHLPQEILYINCYITVDVDKHLKKFKTKCYIYLEARSLHVNKSPIHLVTRFPLMLLHVYKIFV